MNLLTAARERMAELSDLLQHTSNARMAAAARRSPPARPAATRIEVRGMGMVRVCDASTGRVLGFRDSYREAQWLAAALERGETQGAV